MDVILHLGAHMCATRTFQDYLLCNATRLRAQGLQVWGPRRTQNGLFTGLLPAAETRPRPDGVQRAVGRVRLNLAQLEQAGTARLIVSDAAMMGSTRVNLRMAELYCGVGERVARLVQAFEGRRLRVVVNIRALDAYWAAALSRAVTRGAGLPTDAALGRLARSRRGWRDVIEEIAIAVPEAELMVLPYETYGGRPEAQLAAMADLPRSPLTHARGWLSATPRLPELRAWLPEEEAVRLPPGTGRWQPFSPGQAEALRETYADDLMWLVGGASGLARLMDDSDRKQVAGPFPPQPIATRGRRDDEEDRRLAGAG